MIWPKTSAAAIPAAVATKSGGTALSAPLRLQVIGATDRIAGQATERPVHYQDVIAMLYHQLGIDPRKTTVMDPTGRPQYLVDIGQPISELI